MNIKINYLRYISIFLVISTFFTGCGLSQLPTQPQSVKAHIASNQTSESQDSDFSVKYFESFWDAASLGVGAHDCFLGGDGWACGWMLVDGVAVALPIVPGGASVANRAAKTLNQAVSFSHHAISQMAKRRISKSAVREVVKKGTRTAGNQPNTFKYSYRPPGRSKNRVVIINQNGNVITTYGPPSY